MRCRRCASGRKPACDAEADDQQGGRREGGVADGRRWGGGVCWAPRAERGQRGQGAGCGDHPAVAEGQRLVEMDLVEQDGHRQHQPTGGQPELASKAGVGAAEAKAAARAAPAGCLGGEDRGHDRPSGDGWEQESYARKGDAGRDGDASRPYLPGGDEGADGQGDAGQNDKGAPRQRDRGPGADETGAEEEEDSQGEEGAHGHAAAHGGHRRRPWPTFSGSENADACDPEGRRQRLSQPSGPVVRSATPDPTSRTRLGWRRRARDLRKGPAR